MLYDLENDELKNWMLHYVALKRADKDWDTEKCSPKLAVQQNLRKVSWIQKRITTKIRLIVSYFDHGQPLHRILWQSV